jgi:hypothetical protein
VSTGRFGQNYLSKDNRLGIPIIVQKTEERSQNEHVLINCFGRRHWSRRNICFVT